MIPILLNREKVNNLMYDIKLLVKKTRKSSKYCSTVKEYSDGVWIEFRIEVYALIVIHGARLTVAVVIDLQDY